MFSLEELSKQAKLLKVMFMLTFSPMLIKR